MNREVEYEQQEQQEEEDIEKKSKKIAIAKSYLLMDKNELIKNGITGWRLKLVMLMRTKPYDISMVILIISYSLLILLFFALVDTNLTGEQSIFFIIELSLLSIFALEIILHLVSLRCLYMRDCWNIFDMIIILLSFMFVFLDIFVNNAKLQGFLKIRGIFRLLRIFLLIRKLNTLKIKRDIQKKNTVVNNGYDLRSPLEIVLEVLNNLRD